MKSRALRITIWALPLLAVVGCAQWYCPLGECGAACHGACYCGDGVGMSGCQCPACMGYGMRPLGFCSIKENIEPGPPPVSYRPPMPPKFLLVPNRPAVSKVPLDAPVYYHGSVESSYDHEITFPGRN